MPTRSSGVARSRVAGPSEQELRRALGRRYPLFAKVAHPRPGVTGEWRVYKRGTPPVLKVVDGTRTLYYVRPERASVHVTFLLSRQASETALAGGVPGHLQAAIRGAKEFPEGRAVRLELRRLAEFADVEALLAVKLTAGQVAAGRKASRR